MQPFSQAFSRMKNALFNPFDLRKWFLVGFTAFLAELTDYNGGSGSNSDNGRDYDLESLIYLPEEIWDWLNLNTGWFSLIIAGLACLIGLIVLVNWLSARGEFMFLDNVVLDRAEVKKPWYEFRNQGNSLFQWKIIFVLIGISVVLLFLSWGYFLARDIYYESYSGFNIVIPVAVLGLSFLCSIAVLGFISVFLSDFIVPLMYMKNITAVNAWSIIIPVLKKHPLYFLGYYFLKVVLWFFIVIGLLFVGLFTCCLGFLVLVIPVIGTVAILPVHYTFRAFSVEFLQQFDPDFRVFPETENLPDESPA